MIKRFRLATWLLAAVAFSVGASQGEQRRLAEDVDTVKVAVLVKLIQFVSWPDASAIPSGNPATLCVLGKDRWIPLLQQATQGESLNDRPIAVVRITKAREA